MTIKFCISSEEKCWDCLMMIEVWCSHLDVSLLSTLTIIVDSSVTIFIKFHIFGYDLVRVLQPDVLPINTYFTNKLNAFWCDTNTREDAPVYRIFYSVTALINKLTLFPYDMEIKRPNKIHFCLLLDLFGESNPIGMSPSSSVSVILLSGVIKRLH